MTYSLNWDLDSIFAGGSDSGGTKRTIGTTRSTDPEFYTQTSQWHFPQILTMD